ncbi:ISAs1 family transposase [Streptosporangium sp. G11]|uniref:ISAs1 family transposase n=1 Tax=Streptosporangium sp. G11 TaxID=3436926 RepID=UPI003EB6AF9A
MLALAACGVAVVGGDSIVAVWHWAADACPQELLAEPEVCAIRSPGCMYPRERTFRRVLSEVDGDELDRQVCAYLADQEPHAPRGPDDDDRPEATDPAWSNEREARRARQRRREHPAMSGLLPAAAADGKAIRDARRSDGSRSQLLSLFCRTRHTPLAQRAIDAKTSEAPELKPLIANVNKAGRVLTADALHTVRESARHLAEDLGAYYVLMVERQSAHAPGGGDDPAGRRDRRRARAGRNRAHRSRSGTRRSERRTIRTVPADGIDFPDTAQVFRIVRHVADLTGSGVTKEVAYGITNMTADLARPAHLNLYVRSHWGVETREHYVRDVTFREDAGHIRTGRLPQVMAACRNLAIGAFRHVGHAKMAHARRHYRNDARHLLTLFHL